MPEKHKSVAGIPASVREVRGWLDDALTAAGFGGIDVAVLLVSELVTNSIDHSESAGAGGKIHVLLKTLPGQWIQVEVRDAGVAYKPGAMGNWHDGALQLPEADAEGGRGLYLVANLSDTFGWDTKGGMFWFRLLWTEPAEAQAAHLQEALW